MDHRRTNSKPLKDRQQAFEQAGTNRSKAAEATQRNDALLLRPDRDARIRGTVGGP